MEDKPEVVAESNTQNQEPEGPPKSKFPKKDNKYDLNDEGVSYIILGTGLTESIVGASLALHGKKCLYLDQSDKYGGTISNFSLE
jgi:hypothetical protein